MTQHIYETGVLYKVASILNDLDKLFVDTGTMEFINLGMVTYSGITNGTTQATNDAIGVTIDHIERYWNDSHKRDVAIELLCDAWMLLNPEADYSDYQGVVKVPVIGVLNTGTRQVDIPIVDGSQSLEDQLSDEVYIGDVIVTDEGNYRITPLGYARTVWLFKYDKDYREAVLHLMGDIAKRNLSQEEHALAMLHDDAMTELAEDEHLPFAYPEAVGDTEYTQQYPTEQAYWQYYQDNVCPDCGSMRCRCDGESHSWSGV